MYGKLLNGNDIIKEVLDENYDAIITNNSDYSTEGHIIDEIDDKLNKFKEEYENKLQREKIIVRTGTTVTGHRVHGRGRKITIPKRFIRNQKGIIGSPK